MFEGELQSCVNCASFQEMVIPVYIDIKLAFLQGEAIEVVSSLNLLKKQPLNPKYRVSQKKL